MAGARAAKGSDDDDRQFGQHVGTEFFENRQAVATRHLEVEQNGGWTVPERILAKGLVAVNGFDRTRKPSDSTSLARFRRIVRSSSTTRINSGERRHRRSLPGFRGRVEQSGKARVNEAPGDAAGSGRGLEALRRCARAISRAMARPRPVPLGLGGEEGLEEMRRGPRPSSLRRCPRPPVRPAVLPWFEPGSDPEQAAFGHRLDGVLRSGYGATWSTAGEAIRAGGRFGCQVRSRSGRRWASAEAVRPGGRPRAARAFRSLG